jgi:hypothetical protein
MNPVVGSVACCRLSIEQGWSDAPDARRWKWRWRRHGASRTSGAVLCAGLSAGLCAGLFAGGFS